MKQIDKLRRIRDFLEKEAPRSGDNSIPQPYSNWIKSLNRDIEMLARWEQSQFPLPKEEPWERK